MRTITYEAAEEQEETVSAFLMMFLEYATEIGAFRLLESRADQCLRNSNNREHLLEMQGKMATGSGETG